jgi:hypothetical protein
MQSLEQQCKIQYVEYRMKYVDFKAWRDGFQNRKFLIPKPEVSLKDIMEVNSSVYPQCFLGKPIAHFIYQAMTVQDIPGKTVDKGEDSTDDIFRTVTMAYTLLNDPEVAKYLKGSLRGKGNFGIAAVAGSTAAPNATDGSAIGMVRASGGGSVNSSIAALGNRR